jgi:hypothetical protein
MERIHIRLIGSGGVDLSFFAIAAFARVARNTPAKALL